MTFAYPRSCSLFLFDLDGTLIDSKQDIAGSVNFCLRRMGFQQIPISRVSGFVGEGVQRLIQRALQDATGREPDEEQVRQGIALFMEEYECHLLDTTRLYPGVHGALDSLHWASFGVVTNKPERFSRRIMQGLDLEDRFCVILGGDSTPRRKPDPAPLHEAMRLCGSPAEHTVMVGDSPVDVAAGKAAGVVTCGISGGFRGYQELADAGCDIIIEDISSLPSHFCPPTPRPSKS